MAREPSARYIALMNGPYDRLLARAWGDGEHLTITYDGQAWTATMKVRPRETATGRGLTLERALADLAATLGVVWP